MKKLLLILLCLPLIGFGQFTFVPDDNFEQALINLGVDFQTEQMTSNAHVEYTYEVFLNGNKKYSEKFEIDALAGQHMLGWNTKEGMVIDNVVTSN